MCLAWLTDCNRVSSAPDQRTAISSACSISVSKYPGGISNPQELEGVDHGSDPRSDHMEGEVEEEGWKGTALLGTT
ncbi:hypothetical protein T265_00472 [Opisthorchis viverrini]|uniref:Uncharacterized protein n=1 Tax=Opisthorchis viverrini TaxID=6198 RepID=A0A075A269_OPIVI|nr:hypothetical protein T265_00472 [Opisthorchis viverrini]KER33808.1 hypothetical protein T265_00472 [Opisthorchis viverrini]